MDNTNEAYLEGIKKAVSEIEKELFNGIAGENGIPYKVVCISTETWNTIKSRLLKVEKEG